MSNQKSKSKSKFPKPLKLEAEYVYLRKIFNELDDARSAVRRAMDPLYIKSPSHALWYRDGLEKLIRLEAQADALTYVFQKTQEDLRAWLAGTKAWAAYQERKQ